MDGRRVSFLPSERPDTHGPSFCRACVRRNLLEEPLTVCVCVLEGGDGAPHGGEGGAVQRGSISHPEWSASRRQGQGSTEC